MLKPRTYYSDELDDNDVIPDGGSLRVRMTMMDAKRIATIDARNRSYAFDANDHRPHFGQPTELENFRRGYARSIMIDRAVNGWRTMGRDQLPEPPDEPDDNPDDPDIDDQARRKMARDQYIKRTTSAWRTRMPAVTGWPPGPNADVPGPQASNRLGAAGDSRRPLLSTRDAQQLKDAAYAEYVQRTTNAWRGGR